VEETIARALAILLPKMHILHNILHVLTGIREHMQTVRESPNHPWHMGEQMLLCGIALGIVAIFFAPIFLHMPFETWEQLLLHQLIPWRV